MERETKQGVYICFACRRNLFFCSLILYWQVPPSVLFNSEKYSQLKCNIVQNISNTLAPVILKYNKIFSAIFQLVEDVLKVYLLLNEADFFPAVGITATNQKIIYSKA